MTHQMNHALPVGFELDEYLIERQLSMGGFSIVYLATDPQGTPVAIKEYLRLMAEVSRDLQLNRTRFIAGVVSAF